MNQTLQMGGKGKKIIFEMMYVLSFILINQIFYFKGSMISEISIYQFPQQVQYSF